MTFEVVNESTVRVIAPPYFAGSVDVTYVSPNAQTAVAPRGFTYEGARYLIPLIAREFPGTNGAVWRARLLVHNGGPNEFGFTPAIICSNTCPNYVIMEPQSLRDISWWDMPIDNGRIIEVIVGDPAAASFHLVAEDTTRLATTAGTELPVVNLDNFFADRFRLIGFEASPNYRHNLRIYGDGPGASVTVRLFEVIHSKATELVGEIVVPLRKTFVQDRSRAAYAEVALDSFMPSPGRSYVVEIVPPAETTVWAFATVTNNATQHIKTITPNH